MEALRQYIFSVSTGAILCGLVISLTPKGGLQGIIRLICGVFLALLVIQPLTSLRIDNFLSRFTNIADTEGDAAVAFGEEIARDSMAAYIKREAEAYILDKAHELGVTVQAEVTVGREDLPLPVAAVIQGDMPDPLRRKLETQIVENMGIAKEKLQWIGQS